MAQEFDDGIGRDARIFFAVAAATLAATLAASGCSSLKDKSVAAAGTVSAVKIESSGGTNTGTPMPNVLMGGAAFAFADSPDTDRRPIFVRAARTSFLSRLFGATMDDSATIYIGCPGESADDTAKRIKAGVDAGNAPAVE